MKIDIDDALYERISKIAQARSQPTSAEREIEKALALYLVTWENFYFGIAGGAATANTPAPLWEGGPSY